MIRTIADISVTIFVWYVMFKQLCKVVVSEWAVRKRKRPPAVWDSTNADPAMVQAYAAHLDKPNSRIELKPGLSSDVYVAKCPHCNIPWPVKSKDDPRFLEHPRAITPYQTVDCTGSGQLVIGKLWNNEEYPYRTREGLADWLHRRPRTLVSKCLDCGVPWPVLSKKDPRFISHCRYPFYNHTRDDSRLTPCPECERPINCEGSGKLTIEEIWPAEEYPHE